VKIRREQDYQHEEFDNTVLAIPRVNRSVCFLNCR